MFNKVDEYFVNNLHYYNRFNYKIIKKVMTKTTNKTFKVIKKKRNFLDKRENNKAIK